MREDELATRVVEHFRAAFDDVEIHLEEPYDHYGNRGVADVYIRVRTPEPVDYLIELKADAAIRHATGANEILRQYRRMERYFYKDNEHHIRPKLARDGPGVHALLLFAPTERCVRHVREHSALYESVDPETVVEDVAASRKVAFLTNLDRAAEGELSFLSVNSGLPVDSDAFAETVPAGSRLAEALDETRDGATD
ncbi:hypothetical protein E6P09_16510 (plasmid) [Haloferax mediterranei ATCC 33500]|uniref:Uncharacterized protein n=1 Tax=Haloferax mediterranei (strain ATCC 33500 / DSM 1411 / JCM 8866 / NBRC 14739 / NCIMB 2177 / R-4) TaxID=523841 RepID=I3RAZ2_HALMT|nr:hypothetical protein [Haloferax mediterranei]AFK21402.1 hypothetical protein HFX_6280 [Haloferax mediterranei ATCC 33500]AHZ24525.1 hypothetical protein BM92_16590 [Haloferax mediterranei ATCC 33500]ELZ97277.1 hypothetical protein C439_18183 [Haloferax mediterranei ATCC 33500]MDX5990421.1 hypothetical protein [Haloferax mediterranei ATCC 33500]QCQ76921.1 hypothetical protein E6P09_16510 [Haloferax mediterranei ATCC 33500]